CKDDFEIADIDDELCVLDPFELGELYFNLVQDGDIPLANTFVHDLWALDHKWAKFFGNVARDYCRRPEDHVKVDSDSAVHTWAGMDHLFHIYFLGWYHTGDDFFNEEDKIYVTRHKNFEKAIDLLPLRFRNCDVNEVADKLYWDLQHMKNDAAPDYDAFTKVLHEAERLAPGVLAKMIEEGLLSYFE
ncbi:MAG: hypothetical protein IIW82_04185, partial [Clostridia bacterium]|nr:hypothetical protein [Clostridia bacterium]